MKNMTFSIVLAFLTSMSAGAAENYDFSPPKDHWNQLLQLDGFKNQMYGREPFRSEGPGIILLDAHTFFGSWLKNSGELLCSKEMFENKSDDESAMFYQFGSSNIRSHFWMINDEDISQVKDALSMAPGQLSAARDYVTCIEKQLDIEEKVNCGIDKMLISELGQLIQASKITSTINSKEIDLSAGNQTLDQVISALKGVSKRVICAHADVLYKAHRERRQMFSDEDDKNKSSYDAQPLSVPEASFED